MPLYAVAFDIDTRAMRADLVDRQGRSPGEYASARTMLYQSEIPSALARCGALHRKQGSLYHLDANLTLDQIITRLTRIVSRHAPTFRRYVRSLVIYPVGGGKDITYLVADRG